MWQFIAVVRLLNVTGTGMLAYSSIRLQFEIAVFDTVKGVVSSWFFEIETPDSGNYTVRPNGG